MSTFSNLEYKYLYFFERSFMSLQKQFNNTLVIEIVMVAWLEYTTCYVPKNYIEAYVQK